MGSIVTVKNKEEEEINYEFDIAKDGEYFKKDLEKEFKNNERIITIKKTKDIKPEPKSENRKYGYDGWI